MGLKLNGSSSGSVELNAPADTTSGADVVLTLPVNDGDANQFLQTNGSGALSFAVPANLGTAATASGTNLQFNSGYGSVATAFGVRAWIDFDGTAATIGTGNGSGNMDAVTDNGTGDYTVNFTTDMPDNDYCPIITGTTRDNGRLSSGMVKESTTLAVGGFTVTFKQKNSVSYVGWDFYDPADVCIAVVR